MNQVILHQKIRKSYKNKSWKKVVLERDNFQCVLCGKKKKLEVDHIVPFVFIMKVNKITSVGKAKKCEMLWNPDNGRVLCQKCHIKTDTYGNKAKKYVV